MAFEKLTEIKPPENLSTDKVPNFKESAADKVPDFSKTEVSIKDKSSDKVPDFSDPVIDHIADFSNSDISDEKKSTDSENTEENGEIKIREIICRNKDLDGDRHPITGVPFERKTIEVDGELIEGVFPQFDSVIDISLPKELQKAGNKEQFDFANEKLKEAVNSDPELKKKFTEEQLEQIMNGDRPDGYVWHHSENLGELQLIDKDTHDKTGHTGGQVVWGGGNENR